MKIDVREESKVGIEQKLEQAAGSLAHTLSNLSAEEVALLAQNGITSIEAFEGVEVQDLVDMGLSEAQALATLERIK